MLQLLIGLALFLGIHSMQSLAPNARQRARQKWGHLGYKAVYTAIALTGLYLVVQGYALARMEPVKIWTPPRSMQHLTIMLMWLAMVALVSAYVPRNHIRALLQHPMTLAVKIWALAHLLSNGSLADVALFGGFLLWSVLVFRAARQRDRASMLPVPEGKPLWNLTALALGTGVWAAFLMGGLHLWLVGVTPFTRTA